MAVTTIPSSVDAFTSKWQGQSIGAGDPATQTLQKIDLARVQAGKKPLTAGQTTNAIQAVQTRQPVTPVPERTNPLSVWSNVTHDITDLVRGIPQIPMALVNEGRAFLDINNRIDEARSPGDLLQLPGIRLIPGSFTASALLPGGVPAGEILTRPVSTALDVLPFASAAGKAVAGSALAGAGIESKVGTLASAEAARDALRTAAQTGQDLSRTQRMGLQAATALGEERRFIPDLLTRTPDQVTGELVRRPGAEAFRGTKLGQKLAMFSEENRGLASTVNRGERAGRRELEDQAVMQQARQLVDDMESTFGKDGSLAMSTQIRTALEDPAALGFKSADEARTTLPPEAQPFFDRARKQLNDLQEFQLKDDWDSDLAQAPNIGRYQGETYLQKDVSAFTRSDERLGRAISKYQDRNLDQFVKRLEVRNDGLGRYVRSIIDDPTAQGSLEDLSFIRDQWGDDAMKQVAELGAVIEERGIMAAFQSGNMGPGELLERLKPTNRRMSARPQGLLTPKEFASYSRDVTEVRNLAKNRARLADSTIPARFMPTGKRLFYEQAKANFDAAQRLDPELRARYVEAMDLPAEQKLAATQALRAEVGPDTYRLLKYVRPDVDQLWATSETLFRQRLSSFMSEGEYQRLNQDVRKNLNELRGDGLDPVYVPGVAWEKAPQLDTADIRPSNFTPDAVKARTFDYAPQYPDLGVSIGYTAMQDFMDRVLVPHHIQAIEDHAGIPGDVLHMQLQAEAEAAASRVKPLNRDEWMRDYENTAMRKRYAQLDPNSYFGTKRAGASPTAPLQKQMFIPKEADKLLRDMFGSEAGFFQNLVDPISKTFRTSVLLLSPAWHFNNVLSGAMLTAISNPSAFLKLKDAWQSLGGWGAIKDGSRVEGLSGAARSVQLEGALGSLDMDLRSVPENVERIENSLSRTRTVSRIWNEVQEHKLASGTVDRFNKVKDFSIGLNGFFDDMFRVADFEATFERQVAKLVDEGQPLERAHQVAAERALAATQTTFMDFSQMLPIERGILRAVFPFYSWTSHIMRLAFKLPFDHPLRVATINNFTRAELEDWQSGYPPIFRRLLGFADPKTAENFIGLNVDAFNPFRDVGNALTMAGVAGQTNPLIQEMFRQLGVDPTSGGPEYQPNFVYDPGTASGTALDTGNPIINLAASIVPQAATVARFFGLDADFRKLELSNPAAAQRMILSGLRLPIVYRSVNIPESLALEEVKRTNALQEATQTANKTGDVSQVARFDPAVAANLKAMYANRQAAAARVGKGPVQVPGQFITV